MHLPTPYHQPNPEESVKKNSVLTLKKNYQIEMPFI